MERKNSWQLAEAAGFDTPYRFQHLLGRGAWEADALRDEQLGVVLGGLGEDEAVLAIDETGFVKQGKKSVGVKRQYTGTSGKIDHCQIGVFLSWQTPKGHALIDRALYLPEEWAEDKERRQAAGVPADVEFATKPALAREMVARVLAAGARPAWMVADAVYGADYKLRSALEEAKPPYVLAGTGQQCVWMGFGQRRVKAVKTQGARRRMERDQRGRRHQGAARLWLGGVYDQPSARRGVAALFAAAPLALQGRGDHRLPGLRPGGHCPGGDGNHRRAALGHPRRASRRARAR